MGMSQPRRILVTTFTSVPIARAQQTARRSIERARAALTNASRPVSVIPMRAMPGALARALTRQVATVWVEWDAWEFTQGIQGWDKLTGYGIPMLAGKPTVVRSYLHATAPVRVLGELEIAPSQSGPWQTIPSMGSARIPFWGGATLVAVDRRRRGVFGEETLNFLLDEAITARGGTWWLRMKWVWPAGPWPTPTSIQARNLRTTSLAQITFEATPPLRLRLVLFRYRTTTSPVWHEAKSTDKRMLDSWLRRAYPIADLWSWRVTVDARHWQLDPADPVNAAAAQLALAQMAALRITDQASGAHPLTYYYGMVTDKGGFMRGKALGVLPGQAVAVGPTGSSRFPWDTDGSYGDWYGGHEIGHILGRLHPGYCGQATEDPNYPYPNGEITDQLNGRDIYMGFDVGNRLLGILPRILPGRAWHDVMTYCDRQWVSFYTWGTVRQALIDAENNIAPGSYPSTLGQGMGSRVVAEQGPRHQPETDDGEGAYLLASVNLSAGTGNINYVLPATPTPYDRPTIEGRVTVRRRLRDGTSDILPVLFLRDLCRGSDEADEVGLAVAFVPTAEAIDQLELLVDGEVVDEFEPGPEPTAVRDLQLRPGDEGVEEGEATAVLSWADDSAGERGRGYTVQASTDGGEEWVTLAVQIPETSTVIALDDFTEHERVRFRVFSTNGLMQRETALGELSVVDLLARLAEG